MTLKKTNNSNDHTVSEAVSVNKKNYSWGKMITVHQGKDTSYPLHPEHQAKIKALKPGEKTSFTDETNKTVHAEREGDKVHLSSKGTSKKTTVAHSHFTEQRDFFSLRDSLVEKTLTSAEKKKREEIAQAMERENPGMPMAKKMAIATAQAKKVTEETYSDTGWKPQQKVKKDPYGNVIKNRAKSLAKQGIRSAIKDLKKGPEAGKRQVSEAVDHSQMAAMHSAKAEEHGKMAASYHGTDSSDLADRHMELYNAHKDAADAHRQAAKSNNPEDAKKAEEAHKDAQWLSKQYNESVELDELYTSTVKSYIDKARGEARYSDLKRRATMATHKLDPDSGVTKKQADDVWDKETKNIDKRTKGVNLAVKRYGDRTVEEVELDEAETSKLYNYAFDKYADITSGKNKKDKAKAPTYEKIARNAWKMGISRPMKKPNLPEEYENPEMEKVDMAKTQAHFIKYAAEEILEYMEMGGKIEEWYQNKLSKVHSDMEGLHSWVEGNKRKEGMVEGVDLEEAMRHEIAGQVARFIGNKIDPVHGDIMHAHGKEAYRQAAYHIRKTVNDVKDAVTGLHDRLHKQLRTGGLATEETELKEGKYGSFRVRTTSGTFGGPKLPRRSYVAQGDQDPRTGLPLGFSNPPEKTKKPEETKKMPTGGKQ